MSSFVIARLVDNPHPSCHTPTRSGYPRIFVIVRLVRAIQLKIANSCLLDYPDTPGNDTRRWSTRRVQGWSPLHATPRFVGSQKLAKANLRDSEPQTQRNDQCSQPDRLPPQGRPRRRHRPHSPGEPRQTRSRRSHPGSQTRRSSCLRKGL